MYSGRSFGAAVRQAQANADFTGRIRYLYGDSDFGFDIESARRLGGLGMAPERPIVFYPCNPQGSRNAELQNRGE